MPRPFRWVQADVDFLVSAPKALRGCPEASNADQFAYFSAVDAALLLWNITK